MKTTKLLLILVLLSTFRTLDAQTISFAIMKNIVDFSDYNGARNYIATLGYDHKIIDVKETHTIHSFKSLKVNCVWDDDNYDYNYYNNIDYYSPNTTTAGKKVAFVTKCSYQFNDLLKEIVAQGFYEIKKTPSGNGYHTVYKSDSYPGLTIKTLVDDTDTKDIFYHRIIFAY